MNPVLSALGRALIDSTLAFAVVAAVTRLVPRMPASMRATLWWLAALGTLVGFAPTGTLRLSAPATPALQQGVSAAVDPAGTIARTLPAVPAPRVDDVLVALWALGALLVAARLVREQVRLDQVWKRARRADAATIAPWAWSWLRSPGWAAVPAVRISEETTVPLTTGWLRPRILVPAGSEGETLRLALAHEFAHVRRHDLLFGWVPALAQVLLWFSPLTWFASREYGQAREEACDAEALRLAGTAPRAYGELLLHFGVANPMPSSAVALCGSRTAQALKRRLLKLESALSAPRGVRLAGAIAVALVAAVVLPVRVVWGERGAQGEFGYAFHLAGQKGSMGSVRESDFEPIERLIQESNGAFWMFRFGGERWVVRDPELVETALAELQPQGRIEKELIPIQKRLSNIDAWLSELRIRQGELATTGGQTRAERDRLEKELAELERARSITAEREERGRRRMEEERPGIEARLAALGRMAIDEGKAERVR